MSDNNEKKQAVDLSELQNLQFSTGWTPSTNTKKFEEGRGRSSGGFRKDFKRREGGGFRREGDGNSFRREGEGGEFKKREFNPNKRREFSKDGKPQGDFKGGRRPFRKDFKNRPPFKFTMDVQFYPEDAPFDKLTSAMKHLKRTYQLFDIAELILEKQERLVVLAKNLPEESGVSKPLFCSQPSNIPFEYEDAAKRHALNYWLDELFEKVEIEVEAPKGVFQVVNKCSITGDVIGAPNWHKYQDALREYHREKFERMPYEKFLASIETVRDEALVAQWLESMKKRIAYKLKGGEEMFDSKEAAFAYIEKDKGDTLVKQYEQVRMHGADIGKLPFGRIRKNIENMWRKQRKFPIITANNLRGRLRRAGFTIYKRGSKGFAFVCAVKRKFLYVGDKLSDNPQKILDFINAHPGIKSAQLPYLLCGLSAPTVEDKAPTLAEAHEKPTEVAPAVPEIKEEQTFSVEQLADLKNAATDLLWLISEGYVVEYANGALQANPYLPRPKDKTVKTTASSDEEEIEEMQLKDLADEPIIEEKIRKESDADEDLEDESEEDSAEEKTGESEA